MSDESEPLISKRTPLPTKQIIMICIVTFVEPVQFGILFPFVYFMVKGFHLTEDETELGRYVGWIASSFCIAQLVTSLPWGWISDKIGRRPVIIVGLFGNAITCALFGISESFTFAIVLRTLNGLLNGNVGVIKSMLGEVTDESNRGQAFSYWEAAYGLGTIFGPMLGGILVNPVEQYPWLFGDSLLFKRYPYLLPCLVSAVISMLGAILGMLIMDETLRSKRPRTSINTISEEEELLIPQPTRGESITSIQSFNSTPLPLSQVLNSKVCLSILCYATWCLVTVVYEEVYALYVAEPLSHGGLAFTSYDIGLALSLSGFVQVFVQLVIYPYLEHTIGNVKTFRLAAILMAVFSCALPFCTDVARSISGQLLEQGYTTTEKSIIFWLLFALLAGKTLASVIGYIPVIIFVNDSTPNQASLGTVHGFGQVSASLVRSLGPAMSGYLWSWSISNGYGFPFDFHFTLLLVGVMSMVAVVESYLIARYF